jgi:hypothetical protein
LLKIRKKHLYFVLNLIEANMPVYVQGFFTKYFKKDMLEYFKSMKALGPRLTPGAVHIPA